MKDLKISPLFMFLIIILIVVFIYVYFVFMPLSGKVSEINSANKSMIAEIETLESNFGKYQEMEKEKADIQNEISVLNNRIKNGVDSVSVLSDINSNAQNSGIKTDNISTGKTAALTSGTNEDYKISKTTYDISLSGTSGNISKFLKSFEENTAKFYRVESMSLTPQITSAEYFNITEYKGSVKLAVYFSANS